MKRVDVTRSWLAAASLVSMFASAPGCTPLSFSGDGSSEDSGLGGASPEQASGGTGARALSGSSGGRSNGGASAASGGRSSGAGATGVGGAKGTAGASARAAGDAAAGGRAAGGDAFAGGRAAGGSAAAGGRAAGGGGQRTAGGAGRTSVGGAGGAAAGASDGAGMGGMGGGMRGGGSRGLGGGGAREGRGGAAGAAGAASNSDAGNRQTGPNGSWRIMPLGDSITVTTCYPQLLSKKLVDNGKKDFVFVGSIVSNQVCGADVPITQSEGMGGLWVTNLVAGGVDSAKLPAWCAADQADVVLMHFGTNDIWGTQPTQKILDSFAQVIAALRAVNPNVVVLVAQILPMNPDNCSACGSRVEELNAAIPDWASRVSSADSPVRAVDIWSAVPKGSYVPNSAYTKDGVHPDVQAAQRMADTWYEALQTMGIP